MSGEQFDWDDANTGHISLHGITPLDAEQCILDDACGDTIGEWRGAGPTEPIGMTSTDRILAVVFAMRGPAIRPVTSYPAAKIQQLEYLRQWKA